ncbi:MAG: Unknown protein, partial [uncultured Sulfurovum sp.]
VFADFTIKDLFVSGGTKTSDQGAKSNQDTKDIEKNM